MDPNASSVVNRYTERVPDWMAQKGRWSVAVYELVAGSSTPLLRVAKLLSLRLCPVWCGAREIRPLKTSLGFEGIRAAQSLSDLLNLIQTHPLLHESLISRRLVAFLESHTFVVFDSGTCYTPNARRILSRGRSLWSIRIFRVEYPISIWRTESPGRGDGAAWAFCPKLSLSFVFEVVFCVGSLDGAHWN